MRALSHLTLLLGFSAAYARDNAAPDAATRKLAFDIFKQLIEINTTDSVGNVTTAAKAMQQRLLDAGFAPEDVVVAGPNESKETWSCATAARASSNPSCSSATWMSWRRKREDWTTDPFQFVEKDGYFYGRGTQDVKVGDAILIATLIRFKREGYVPNRDLIVALTAGEESGASNGVDWLLKNRRDLVDAEYVLNPDSGGIDSENGKVVDVAARCHRKTSMPTYLIVATNPGGCSSLPRRPMRSTHWARRWRNCAPTRFPSN